MSSIDISRPYKQEIVDDSYTDHPIASLKVADSGIVDSTNALINVTELLKSTHKATLVLYGSGPSSVFPTLTCLAADLDIVLPQPCVSFIAYSTQWELTTTKRSLQHQTQEIDCQEARYSSWLDASTIGLSVLENSQFDGLERTLVLFSPTYQLKIISVQRPDVPKPGSHPQLRWHWLMMLELPERVANLIVESNAQCVIEAPVSENDSLTNHRNDQFQSRVEMTVRHITSLLASSIIN